ncbi:hypothetical protein [Pediococcus argentinicus]|uniref:hypothetical protein n=1 Tax=Pediococcus argentinicus TaxID=480391 RepID=UPI00164BB730|nr:hypothetical protein [Pediococcus argentinicus]
MIYGKDNIYFANGKVTGGSTKSLLNQVQQHKKEQKDTKVFIQGAADRLGTEATEHLSAHPETYQEFNLDTGEQAYVYKSQYALLIRIDSPNRVTNVYQYSQSAKYHIGKRLFTGRTIFQKQKPTVQY